MQNFVRFHAIESEIKLSQKFWKKEIAAPLLSYIFQNASILYLMLHIVYIIFGEILFTRSRNKLITKISEKVSLQRNLYSDFY